MHQIQIPILPIPERTTWEELPEMIEAAFALCEEQFGVTAPLFLFVPCKPSRIPGEMPVVSGASEELLVVAIELPVREAVFQALERVEAREPEVSVARSKQAIEFKNNTTLKSVYRQMRGMPATVFSVTFPDDGPDAFSIFFLRTTFTVSEFQREMQRPIG